MRVKLDKALVIIVATAVLHNMLRQRGEDQLPPDHPELIIPAPWEQLLAQGQMDREPVRAPTRRNVARDDLVQNYFQSLL